MNSRTGIDLSIDIELQATLSRLEASASTELRRLAEIELQSLSIEGEIHFHIKILEIATHAITQDVDRTVLSKMVTLAATHYLAEIARAGKLKNPPGETSIWTAEVEADLLEAVNIGFAHRKNRKTIAYEFRLAYPDIFPAQSSLVSEATIARQQENAIYKRIGVVLKAEEKRQRFYRIFHDILG